jgi:hypothetical protein
MNHQKIIFPLIAFVGSFFLSGCKIEDIEINNRTPSTLAENHSNVYTLTASVTPRTTKVVRDSLRANIVIDGETFPMKVSSLSPDLFEFEYHLPAGRQDASYYFLVDYKVDLNGFLKDRESFSAIQSFKLANRYAYSLDVTRAPVGSRVGVVGRGFKQGDVIQIGGLQAPTSFSSANALHFHVPSLEPGRNYMVQLSDGDSLLNVGSLRIDAGTITVSPTSLTLNENQRAMIIFSINATAPQTGFLIDVTTDIAESIVMPEVLIPAGARSVNVPVTAGIAGRGSLFIEMDGYNSITIPVTVR